MMPDNIVLHAGNIVEFGETHMVMMGRVVNQHIKYASSSGVIPMIEIGTMSIDKSISQVGRDNDNTGLISMDGLFCPYVININGSGHATLPSWIAPTSTNINATNLNPFNPSHSFSTGINHFNSQRFFDSGTNIAYQNRFEAVGSGTTGDLSSYNELFNNATGTLNTIKAVGFKAPLVLTGWGYDTDGKPVPASETDPNVFATGAFRDPTLWKSGPLDARWDDSRQVWSAVGTTTQVYLSKITNTYNPPNFSYEVERSLSRDQFTRFAPSTARTFSASDPIYDPEYLAYTANPNNVGTYEQLDYTGLEFPHYEAFIIRETIDEVGQTYYNIWSEDCQDCGHMSNQCPSGSTTRHGSSSIGKKILIENPLKQNLDAGDLCFTMKTGRTKNVNTGTFVGGSGVSASGNVVTNSSGVASFAVTSAGSGYAYGGFGLISSGVCASLSLTFTGGVLVSGTVDPTTGFARNKTYPVSIYPTNATTVTESLDIHWIMNSEYKTQQVVSHVACDGGLLQTCSIKIQTQYSTCEWCGEDSALTNGF